MFISKKIDFMVIFNFDGMSNVRFLWIVDVYWMYGLVTIPTGTTSTIVGEKSGITGPQFPSSQFVSPSTTHREWTDSSLGFSTREFLVSTSSQGRRRLAIR